MNNMSVTRLAWLVFIFLCMSFKSFSAQINNSSPSDEPISVGNDGNQTVTRPPEVEVGFSYERLTNGFADWLSFYVEALKEFKARTSLHATFRQTDRFSLKDQELSAGMRYPLGRTWAALVEGRWSLSHQVLPRWSLMAHLDRFFGAGWVIHLGLRHTEFEAATTNSGILIIESYWGSNRASYSFYLSQLVGGGTALSHVLQTSYYYNGLSSLNLVFAIGRELENLQPIGGVLSSHLRSLALFGRHGFADHWAIAYEVLVHEQGDIYTRKGLRIGLRYLF